MNHIISCPFCGVSTEHEMSYGLQSYVCEACHNLIAAGMDDCCLFFSHDLACLCQRENEKKMERERAEEEEEQALLCPSLRKYSS
ncbi:hypothetical protein PsalN5692_00412 [Piscirickettsia salmonis]|uniref:hypothetical protein n=1 Tax=Piscirickettsia salmonis TaxID=1238 RepID=UPI0012B851F6|nr:hypothetical protein [Piscirickettsia salmonis]QGP48996.1 hypothetical protein PsalN5692_00412 [Piscirickettsia salmonis]QGP56249.1 hypothetical protein PsalSR1_03726 [Piscirickettsia salmonis]QGP57880.1 hypothetical protein PsalBI1_00426 [Piscirickettsia salmonis]QGP65818.1 hypothetical protein PsalMR5_03731 [Piscirickettsia salmonis]